jgi:starvation-inducible DNA-binding protein
LTKNLHMNQLDFLDYHLLLIEHAEQISAMTHDVAERAHKIGGTTLRSISDISEPQCLENNSEEPFAPNEDE